MDLPTLLLLTWVYHLCILETKASTAMQIEGLDCQTTWYQLFQRPKLLVGSDNDLARVRLGILNSEMEM